MHNNKRRNMNGGGTGGGPHRHNNNNNNRPRRFNNNRPEGGGGDAASISRTRRNALQNREKYQMMARDAQSSGDRVLGEYYLQHADHYHRVLLSLPPEEAPRPQFQRYTPNGEQQPGSDQHGGQPHDDASPSANGAHEQAQPAMHEHAHGLPSFITQPVVAPEEPGQ